MGFVTEPGKIFTGIVNPSTKNTVKTRIDY
jgi:hypothetical protein